MAAMADTAGDTSPVNGSSRVQGYLPSRISPPTDDEGRDRSVSNCYAPVQRPSRSSSPFFISYALQLYNTEAVVEWFQ